MERCSRPSVPSHLLTITCHSEDRWPHVDTATCRPAALRGPLGRVFCVGPPRSILPNAAAGGNVHIVILVWEAEKCPQRSHIPIPR